MTTVFIHYSVINFYHSKIPQCLNILIVEALVGEAWLFNHCLFIKHGLSEVAIVWPKLNLSFGSYDALSTLSRKDYDNYWLHWYGWLCESNLNVSNFRRKVEISQSSTYKLWPLEVEFKTLRFRVSWFSSSQI